MPITTGQVTESEDTESEVVDNTVEEEVVEENLPDVNIVVEDGSGIADSNVYCDLDYALEYCVSKGYSKWTSLTEEQQKVYLIRGTDFIDNFFDWNGRRKDPLGQAMAFPRVNMFYEGVKVEGIPNQLKKACVEAAFLCSKSTSTTLFTQRDSNGEVKKKKVDTLEKEYFQSTSSTGSVDYTSIYDILNKLLKGFYRTKDEAKAPNTRALWLF